jgi:predicted nucleotidyltransferase
MSKSSLQRSAAVLTVRNRKLAIRVATAARRIVGNTADIVVFGSAAQGTTTAASDLDILILVPGELPPKLEDRASLKAAIEKAARLPLVHEIELHLVTRKAIAVNPIYRTAFQEGIHF